MTRVATIAARAAGLAHVLLDREEQLWHCLIEASAGQKRHADNGEGRTYSGAGTEAQRGLDMLDRDVGLASPIPEGAAEEPPPRVVRVKR